VLAPKQESYKQAQCSDGCPAGHSQDTSDSDRVGAAGGIIAVAQQADVIGPSSCDPFSGIDNREPDSYGIDRKTGERSRKAAVGRDYECGRGVRKLVAVAIIDGDKPQCLGEGTNRRGIASQEVRRGGVVTIQPDLRLFHTGCIGCRILRIESNHDQAEIGSWTQSAMAKGVRNDRNHRPTQRLASVVRQEQDARLAPQPELQRFLGAVFALQW
jgi:hypothetical protein